jgi:SAM-dependent methyltransferase
MSATPHSAEYIDDDRFDWWSPDFLRLSVTRAVGDRVVTSLADFGVGEGHWSLGLAAALPDLTEVAGVDRESEWLRRSAEKYAALAPRIAYRAVEADASATPLPDDAFDLVTAQTLLMHSLAPEAILAEMRRVAKPGGVILCVEPVNHMNWAQTLELTHFCAPEERARIIGIWLRFVEVLKSRSGDQDIGLRLPTLFERAGLQNIRAWSNDRVRLTPIEEFDMDFIEEELSRARVAEALIEAGVGEEDLAFLRRVAQRAREQRPRELDYVLRAPINIVCAGAVP